MTLPPLIWEGDSPFRRFVVLAARPCCNFFGDMILRIDTAQIVTEMMLRIVSKSLLPSHLG